MLFLMKTTIADVARSVKLFRARDEFLRSAQNSAIDDRAALGFHGVAAGILAGMEDRNAERETKLAAPARPGRIIVLGAAAMAFGALMTVKVLGAYVTLAGQSPELDDAQTRLLRAPDKQWALWTTLVESAFLLVAGFGLVKFEHWARPLFFALAITRVCVLTWSAWHLGVADSTLVVAFSVLKTIGIYGFGVWLLTRPGVGDMFLPPGDSERRNV
jgi:hypothetical protein